MDIVHRIVIEASPQQIFQALTSAEQLSAWWTRAEAADAPATWRFRFGPDGSHEVDMAELERRNDEFVRWRCVAGPWTHIRHFSFRIEPHARGGALTFINDGWPQADEFFGHCNSKWGFFLGVSLKQLLETGEGRPSPMDPNL